MTLSLGVSSNLRQQQLGFCANIRDPENVPVPGGLELRRVRIYQELVFNNIESLLASTLPVTVSILSDDQWLGLVRGFVKEHSAQTPYFSQLTTEFLQYLSEITLPPEYPGFLLELIHYEQMELEIFMRDSDDGAKFSAPAGKVTAGALGSFALEVSSRVQLLAYAYPVHQISPAYIPNEVPEQPTCLLVFQDSEGDVRFLDMQPLGYQLVEFLQKKPGSSANEFFGQFSIEDTQQSFLLMQCEPLLRELTQLRLLTAI